MNKATLLRRIDAFLQVKKKSSDGYAPVDSDEVSALLEITQGLIKLKYEADMDGDLPVEVTLIDRTRYERPFVLPVRYTHKPVEGRSELELHQHAAENYALMARAANDSVHRHLQAVACLMRGAVDNKTPLVFGQVRFVASPPKGVTLNSAAAELQKAVDSACKKEPPPVEYPARDGWMVRIAERVAKKLNLEVKAGSCSHTVEGVRVYFDVPQFDATVRITSGRPEEMKVISLVEG